MKNERLELLKKCKTTDEIIELAKKYELNISKKDAEVLFNKFNAKDESLSDNELANVSDGSSCGNDDGCYDHEKFSSADSVQFIFSIGQKVHTKEGDEVIIDNIQANQPFDPIGYWEDGYHIKGVWGWWLRTKFKKD